MYSKTNAIKIVEILKYYYPDAKCSLDFKTPFEFLERDVLHRRTSDRVCRVGIPIESVNCFPYLHDFLLDHLSPP